MSTTDSSVIVKTPDAATPRDANRRVIDDDRIVVVARCWIAVGVVAYLADLFRQSRVGLTDGVSRAFGDDFINYWSGAFLAWHDRTPEIFDWAAFHVFQQSFTGPDIHLYHYGYPPVLLMLTAPLAVIPYVSALGLWLVSSWYAFYRSLKLAAPQGALLLSLATPALFVNAVSGQNGAWTAALLGGGLMCLDRRPALAGVMFGLLIYKPHLGILLPVALLAGQRWRAIVSAAATALCLVIVSLMLFGFELWAEYFERMTAIRQAVLEDGTGVWHRMLSVFVFGRRLGLDVTSAYALQLTCAIAVVGFVVASWWRDDAPEIRNTLVILGTCLATPYLQDYDMVMGAFVVVWLTVAAKRSPVSSPWIQPASAAILVLPLMAGALGQLTGLSFGPVVFLLVFVMVAQLGWMQRHATRLA